MSCTFRALIGVDGSEDAEEAFQFYAEKMHNPEQEALLVYVVKPLTISSNELSIYIADIREKNLTEEKTRVKQIKETYEDRMRTQGIRGKINIIYYSRKPGKILCDLAHEEKCAVIVVGCRRSGTANLGPTVDYVLRKASCPVILTGGKQRRESFDSVASLGQFQVMKSSRDSSPKFRRISCPVMKSPPLIPEEVGGAVGGATGDEAKSMLGAKVDGGASGGLQLPAKQRRHSTVVNVFQQLTLQGSGSGRKKLLPKQSEETNGSEDTKC